MNAIKLLEIGVLSDGTRKFQSQLLRGKDSADFIMGNDGVMKCWGKGAKGFDFYPYGEPYEIISGNPRKPLNTPVVNEYKFVRSRYASTWSGIVIDKKHRTGNTDLYQVLVLKDKNGNTPRKRIIKTIDSFWTVVIDKFDISNINQSWLSNLPIL